MTLHTIPTLAAILLLSLTLYRYILYPLFLSPLSRVPSAHWSAPLSRLWILSHRRRETETPAIHRAHQRLGPIIQLAPNELSINSVEGGIRTIYAGGYEKGDWYLNVFSNYGVQPMFAMPGHGPHSKRKRMLSNIYAKTTLQASEPLKAITRILLEERLMPRLREMGAGEEQGVEFYDVFAAITMDFVSAYVFGLKNGSDLVRKPDMNRKFFRDYKARQRYQFWPQELPQLTAFLGRIGLKWLVVPKWVNKANADIEAWLLEMCDNAEATLNEVDSTGVEGRPKDHPTAYAHLRSALLKESSTKGDLDVSVEQMVTNQRLAIASELLDHTIAGFDTSSITLTFYAWQLSRPCNVDWQAKLRAELANVSLDDAKCIDALPILHATLMETLRLNAAIPGAQPRITPPSATLGAPGPAQLNDLPANVRVQSQAWSLHRNADVFPEPETWKPARWLPEHYPSPDAYAAAQKEMGRWFWAFGSGGRMCVGSNLAMLDMKAIIAAIWRAGRTEVIFDEGMVHRGGFVAEPIGKDGKFCVLKYVEEKAQVVYVRG